MHTDPTVHDGSWADLIAVPQDTSIAPAHAGVRRHGRRRTAGRIAAS
jgi:hypothetical protein